MIVCGVVGTGGGWDQRSGARAVGGDLCGGDAIAKPQCGFEHDLITSLKGYVDKS